MQATVYNVGVYTRLSREDERETESVSIENQKGIPTFVGTSYKNSKQKQITTKDYLLKSKAKILHRKHCCL